MRALVFLSLLLCLPSVFAAKLMSTGAATQEFHLENGLTLIVRVDQRAPVVFTSVWYKVGGSNESSGLTGISHVLEHMMFKGTKRYPAGKFNRLIADNGGQQNAMTSQDYTVYFQRLPADKLALSFQLESDRMHNLVLKKAVFQKELQVVMEERRMRVDDSPQGLTWEYYNAAAFVNNPYHHPVVGWMTDLQHMTVSDLKRWYKTWYVPNNAVVVVVGDVQPNQVYALAKRYFGPLKKQPLPVIKPRSEVLSFGERHITVSAPAKLPWLVMGYHVPTLTTTKRRWQPYALEVISGILDGGGSSRFSQDLIRGRQIAVSVGADYDLYSRYSDLFTMTGTPAKNNTVLALKKAFLNEIERLKNTRVSSAELARVKAMVIAQNIFSKDSLQQQAFDIGVPEMSGLSWRNDQAFVARIKAVTPEQIQIVAKQYFTLNNLTVAILNPKK